MITGEFVEVYNNKPNEVSNWIKFDSVVTCFFLDTARNILDYIETIFTTLKDRGVWVNFGPLLYHWADVNDEYSIELSWEEV